MKTTENQDNVPRHIQRRKRDKEFRYKTLLKAAESLFAEKGYNETSIEEIASLAEVSPGTVYFYFANKEDLLVNLIREIGIHLRQLLGNVYAGAQTAKEGMNSVGIAFFRDFCLRSPEKLSIFFREAVGRSALVEEERKIVYELITADIKNAVMQISDSLDENDRSRLAAEIIAVCIVGIYEKLAYHYLLWSNQTSQIMDIAEDAVMVVSGGITNLLSRFPAFPQKPDG
ncbi:MAG TPA: TetR/AcrR family transcriptional regulator [Spirochaetota bacterium]|nr:TetR/AcrR family transcriptional regulator [Spirochaetota bacterium]